MFLTCSLSRAHLGGVPTAAMNRPNAALFEARLAGAPKRVVEGNKRPAPLSAKALPVVF